MIFIAVCVGPGKQGAVVVDMKLANNNGMVEIGNIGWIKKIWIYCV